MRLSSNDKEIIKTTINNFDEKAEVYLFGSRTDESKKGGDIDLLIMSARIKKEDQQKIKYKLWDLMGEQKIDILIAKDDSHPFTKIALREGVKL